MKLVVLEGELAVARLDPGEPVPAWAGEGVVSSVTRTREELSIVCAADVVPPGARAERGWRCLRIAGQIDFALTGVLSSLLRPLADARLSIFALSTYDTDYVLVRADRLAAALECLRAAGHEVEGA